MLKILQARLQQYVNRELPDVQAGFWLYWVSIAEHRLSLVVLRQSYSSLWYTGSRVLRLSCCCVWIWLLCGMWDLPGPGIQPIESIPAGADHVSPLREQFIPTCRLEPANNLSFTTPFLIMYSHSNPEWQDLQRQLLGSTNIWRRGKI